MRLCIRSARDGRRVAPGEAGTSERNSRFNGTANFAAVGCGRLIVNVNKVRCQSDAGDLAYPQESRKFSPDLMDPSKLPANDDDEPIDFNAIH